MRRFVASPALAALLSGALGFGTAWAGEVSFTTQPTVAKDGDKVKIGFAVAASTDVEVAVLAADGKVVRHLAAGVLGGEKAPPAPLAKGLAQSIEWDGKDDVGKPAAGGPFKFRVRAGLAAKVGGFLGEPGLPASGQVATDEEGRLYVMTTAGWSGSAGNARFSTIKVFDREGKYLKTIAPYPAGLKVEDVKGFGSHTPRDGRLNPPIFNPWVPVIYSTGLGGFLGDSVRNGTLWLLDDKGKICRIRASDGACLSWAGVQSPASLERQGSLGPICWAPAPDGKTLYLSGWARVVPKRVPGQANPVMTYEGDGRVYKVDVATGKTTEFIKVDAPGNSFWYEQNGWYMYKDYWGRMNGMSALHGVAVDKEGRIYVCDRVDQRIGVYDQDGKLLGSTRVEWPDRVGLGAKGPELYVLTRKNVDGHKSLTENKLIKLSGWKDGKVLAELNVGSGNTGMAMDGSKDPAVIWIGTTRIEDKGAALVITGRLNEKAKPGIPIPVKVWADPLSDNIVIGDGTCGQAGFNALTGEPQKWPLQSGDLAFDRDGNYYVYGGQYGPKPRQEVWSGPVARFDRDFKPRPFPGTGTNMAGGREVYGRMGLGFTAKGLWVASDGRIFANFMGDTGWPAPHGIYAWDATGKFEAHPKERNSGLVFPIECASSGVCVDFRGSIYVGIVGQPKGVPGDRSGGDGSVVKFGPVGGGYAKAKTDKPGMEWSAGQFGSFVEGAMTAYPGLAKLPVKGATCTCKEARFEIDGYGRVYVPNAYEYCVRVFDNAGNEIAKLGYYGNPDSRGPGSAVPEPAIPLGFPTCVAAGHLDKGRLYVADELNHRIMRLECGGKAEAICDVK